eukprot:6173252-Pleurochrysis_carterae.AAC.2
MPDAKVVTAKKQIVLLCQTLKELCCAIRNVQQLCCAIRNVHYEEVDHCTFIAHLNFASLVRRTAMQQVFLYFTMNPDSADRRKLITEFYHGSGMWRYILALGCKILLASERFVGFASLTSTSCSYEIAPVPNAYCNIDVVDEKTGSYHNVS